MLTITVNASEVYDEENNKFVMLGGETIHLEHSLVSLSKWEQKYKKPFLSDKEKTTEETLYYLECMIVDPEIPPGVFLNLTKENMKDINDYMAESHTATWFAPTPGPNNARPEVVTSELFYYWMFSLGIDKACETWHLSNLLTLIKVFSEKNQSNDKKRPRMSAADRNKLNEQRLAAMGTNG